MNKNVQSLILPLAMVTGAIFSSFFAKFAPIMTYMIFVMLFIAFCKIEPKESKITRFHITLLLTQIIGSVVIYLGVRLLFSPEIAQGSMVIVFAPTAASASVIASMLGANIATMATFTLLSSFSVALLAPVFFSLIGVHQDLLFWESFLLIMKRIVPLLVAPFITAMLLLRFAPRVHKTIGNRQILSFYIWAFTLIVVSGQVVEGLKTNTNKLSDILILVGISTVIGVCQFAFGRKIGRRFGDAAAGGQALGQKNTILAIWMANTYLSPLAAVAPAMYVIVQNVVNSYQLWRKNSENTEID